VVYGQKMQELKFEVVVNADLCSEVEGVVAFGEFSSPKGTAVVYPDELTELTSFYADLLLGRPFPLTLATRKVARIGRLVSLALFLHRDLAVHPRMPALVAAASLVDQLRLVGLAHVDPDLARFFKFLVACLPPGLSKSEQKDRLVTAVGWIREYVLEDRLPSLPPAPATPTIFDVGTNGFVLAQSAPKVPLEDGWVELFRQGYLRGALFGLDKDGRRAVLAARKSHFLEFDLRRASEALNEVEGAMGEPAGWVTDGLWLEGPEGGTRLLIADVQKVLVRV